MKKRILAAVLAVLMLSTLLIPMVVGAKQIDYNAAVYKNEIAKLNAIIAKSEDGKPIATSDDPSKKGKADGMYELYVDYDTGEFAIRNKITGEITLSNPYNAVAYGNDDYKGKLLSQVIVNYFKITEGKNTKYLYSYKDGFYFNQGKITPSDDGMVVDYSIGEEERDFAVPLKISLEALYGALREVGKTDDKIQELVQANFEVFDPDQKYVKNEFLDKDTTGEYRQSFIDKEPLCETVPFVFLKSEKFANNNTMSVLEKRLMSEAPEYFVLSKEGEEKTQFEIDRDMYWDEEKDRERFPAKEYPNFKLTVNYTLTNDGLVVDIDTDSIVYDRELYCLEEIIVLPYFGAANLNRETDYDHGYLFIPDGSGALVRFEDLIAKKQSGKISATLYGPDYAKYQISGKNIEQYTMPVFGLVNSSEANGTGHFVIIEEGDAMASITAEADAYFINAYATFKYGEYDTYDLADAFSGGTSSSTEITVISKDTYKGNYRMYYKLLMADETAKENNINNTYNTSYVGMATLYRDYLIKNGILEKNIKFEENTKLFLEVFGSIKVKEQILSFPVTVNKELTTFSDIINMQKELSEAGLNNNSFILKGFYNGGLSSSYPTKIKWQRVLGGEDGLNDLLADAENNGYDVALDVDFSYAHSSKWFSGYSNKKNAIKTLDNRYTTKRMYYAATQTFERTSGVAVSSSSFVSLFEKFADSISDVNIKTLAVRALGSDLNSDFNKENFISREDAKKNVVEFLKLMSREEKFDLIVDAGNVYSIPYASAVLSAPLDSSKYKRASESVPFYGMVYHGSIEFAGNALNMEGDEDYMLLKAIENGAVLYYTLAKENVEKLKGDAEYSSYYSINYDFLKASIVENYTKYNEAMKDKQDKYIVDHRFLNDSDSDCKVTLLDGTAVDNSTVVLVVYAGGEGFILNYNSQDIVIEFEGEKQIIQAFDFVTYTTKEASAK